MVVNVDHLIGFLKANITIETFRIETLHELRLSSDSLNLLLNVSGLKLVQIDFYNAALEALLNEMRIELEF